MVVLLRLDSDDARRLSVETLVCELQVCDSDACVGRDGVCVRDMGRDGVCVAAWLRGTRCEGCALLFGSGAHSGVVGLLNASA